MVTVYSKPSCPQCNMTYRVLDAERIDYEVLDVTQDDEAYQKVKDLGYLQAPVVVTDKDHWSGFRPDLIKAIKS